MRTAESRFWAYVLKTDSCWLWQGATLNGYGRFHLEGSSEMGTKRQVKAHRFSYELVNGPIPKGITLDHLCRITQCVNPDHLEPVAPIENLRRKLPHCPTCTCGSR